MLGEVRGHQKEDERDASSLLVLFNSSMKILPVGGGAVRRINLKVVHAAVAEHVRVLQHHLLKI